MNAEVIFKKLQDSKRLKLDELAKEETGIYALFDHVDILRYIGETETGFYQRVGKHTTGSVGKGMSHMFVAAYCVGTMWRYSEEQMDFPPKPGDEHKTDDGQYAKNIRTIFIREHCRATYVSIPRLDAEDDDCYGDRLVSIEKEIKVLAISAGAPGGPVDLYKSEEGFKPGKYQEYTPELDALVKLLIPVYANKLLKKLLKNPKLKDKFPGIGMDEKELLLKKEILRGLVNQKNLYVKYLSGTSP